MAPPPPHSASTPSASGQILDTDLGAQLVEIELVDQGRRERARAVEEEAAAVLGRRLDHDAIDHDLALRRQQRGKARPLGRHLADIGGEEPVEKAPRGLAGDLDDAAIGEKRCFHDLQDLCGTLAKRCAGT